MVYGIKTEHSLLIWGTEPTGAEQYARERRGKVVKLPYELHIGNKVLHCETVDEVFNMAIANLAVYEPKDIRLVVLT